MAEQRTHKPSVESSNLSLVTHRDIFIPKVFKTNRLEHFLFIVPPALGP